MKVEKTRNMTPIYELNQRQREVKRRPVGMTNSQNICLTRKNSQRIRKYIQDYQWDNK